MILNSLLSKIRKHFLRYQPVVEVCIHKSNIIHNYKTFQNTYPPNSIAPVLKSNAYGHGLVEIAKILEPLKPPFFVIDSIFEALRLRNAGIKSPLLIIGYTHPNNIVISKLKNTEFGITAIETLDYLSKHLTKPTKVHLKFDTGMHRQGIDIKDLFRAKQLTDANKNILVTGIFSHLSDPDNKDSAFTEQQINTWNNLVKEIRNHFPTTLHFHLAATYGSAYSSKIDANLIRLGIGLYGYNTSPHQTSLSLKPALELKTCISSIRTVNAGEKVGYNGTFSAVGPTTLATIPVGYSEGLDRALSNVGFVRVNNDFAKICGRVSMNITSLDVSQINNVKVGDRVQVIGLNNTDPNSIKSMSNLASTIPYTLLVHIPQHLRRTVV